MNTQRVLLIFRKMQIRMAVRLFYFALFPFENYFSVAFHSLCRYRTAKSVCFTAIAKGTKPSSAKQQHTAAPDDKKEIFMRMHRISNVAQENRR